MKVRVCLCVVELKFITHPPIFFSLCQKKNLDTFKFSRGLEILLKNSKNIKNKTKKIWEKTWFVERSQKKNNSFPR